MWSKKQQSFVGLDLASMTRNQVLAVRYAEALLEDPDFMGISEMFEDYDLSEEDQREIYGLLAKVTVCFPEEWDNA